MYFSAPSSVLFSARSAETAPRARRLLPSGGTRPREWLTSSLRTVRMAGATCQIIASPADASPPRTDELASTWASVVANEAQSSRNPASASASIGGGRAIVMITDVQANYKVATPESGGSEVLYVRKTSMRDRAAWSGLRVGNRVDLAFRLAAGRAIVSDAVPA